MLKLKEILRNLIEEESHDKSIVVSGFSLEDALQKGCNELNTKLSEIDYEIMEYGKKGMFGVGKKDFKIKIYVAKNKNDIIDKIMNVKEEEHVQFEQYKKESVDKDSEVFVRVTSKGVLIKVTPSIGRGRKINDKKILNAIYSRGVNKFNESIINKLLRTPSNEYYRIGEMPLNVANDSTATVQISNDEMKAYIVITPPKPGGFDLDIDEIRSILRNNGVVVGVDDGIISNLFDYPVYNEPVLIAKGVKVNEGADAKVIYNFRTNKEEIHLIEEDGKVNFKELNIVQNVVAGQILATKEPSSIGEPGRTVTNKLIPARNGKDCNLLAGRNTKVTEDGLNIVAEINGQVYLMGGKVVVDPVYIIQGDVNLKTGNILFLGTVIIQGNVEDGFSIKAAGNIEIHGSVGRCEIEAEGDIIITGGVMGKNEGKIISGKSVYAKFIESVKVEAVEGVYVQDGILHSFIDAIKEIICVGKRGAIVGGRLRAGELVKTKALGSIANPETIVEVGIDPKKRQTMVELEEKRDKAYKDLDPVKANYENLKNQKKVIKKLPDDKEELLKQLATKVNELDRIIQNTNSEIKEIENYLSQLKTKGKIIASKIAYAGVKLYIKNAFLGIKNDYRKVAFILEAGEVNTIPYTEDEIRR